MPPWLANSQQHMTSAVPPCAVLSCRSDSSGWHEFWTRRWERAGGWSSSQRACVATCCRAPTWHSCCGLPVRCRRRGDVPHAGVQSHATKSPGRHPDACSCGVSLRIACCLRRDGSHRAAARDSSWCRPV